MSELIEGWWWLTSWPASWTDRQPSLKAWAGPDRTGGSRGQAACQRQEPSPDSVTRLGFQLQVWPGQIPISSPVTGNNHHLLQIDYVFSLNKHSLSTGSGPGVLLGAFAISVHVIHTPLPYSCSQRKDGGADKLPDAQGYPGRRRRTLNTVPQLHPVMGSAHHDVRLNQMKLLIFSHFWLTKMAFLSGSTK